MTKLVKASGLLAVLILTASGTASGQHFQFTGGEQESHSLVIRTATIDGTDLVADDEIGVFTPDGVCAGAVVISGEPPYGITAWGDDPGTEAVEGFFDGEEFHFRVYDSSADLELDARGRWEEGVPTWQNSEYTIFSEVFAFTSPRPVIELSEAGHDFGLVLVGDTAGWMLRIINNGFSDLTVSDVASDNGVFTTDFAGNLVIAAEESASLNISFTPDATAQFAGTLTITSDDPDNREVAVALSGEGTAEEFATIELSTDAINFGDYPINAATMEQLVISNNGTVGLHIDQISIDVGVFTTDWDGNPLNVPPRQSQELMVTFEPVEEADYAGTLTILSDARDNAEETVALTGGGILFNQHFLFQRVELNHSLFIRNANLDGEPLVAGDEIGVFTTGGICAGASVLREDENGDLFPVGLAAWGDDRNTDEIEGFRSNETFAFRVWDLSETEEYEAAATFEEGSRSSWRSNGLSYLSLEAQRSPDPDVSVAPMELNFGSAYVGATVELEFSVRNSGLHDLRVSNIVSSDTVNFPFDLGAGFVLRTHDVRTFTAVFTPHDAVSYTESLTISSNDPDEGEFVLPLVGEGLPPLPVLRASEYTHEFPPTMVRRSSAFNLTLTNDGWQDLVITEIRSDNEVFTSNMPPEGMTLGRDGSADVTVSFAPTADIQFNGVLTIVSNDGGVPGSETGIALTGAGFLQPQMAIEPLEIDFGGVDWRDQFAVNDELPFRITNIGSGDLTITNVVATGAFTTDFAGQFVLAPDQFQDITVMFDPVEVASYSGVITVTGDDPENQTMELAVTGEGIQINHAPGVVNPIPDQNLREDFAAYRVANLNDVFGDVDGDALTFSAASGDAAVHVSVNDDDELILFADMNWFGQAEVTVTADDGNGDGTADDTFVVNVAPVNDAPFWVRLPDPIRAPENELIEFDVVAGDLEPDALTLTAEIPAGAEFIDHNDRTGTFRWTPDYDQSGNYIIPFTVSDGAEQAVGLVLITVERTNQPPYWAPEPPDVTVNLSAGETEVIEFTVTSGDPDGDAVALSYRSDDIPPEAMFRDNGDGTGTFRWEVSYGDVGLYTAFFTVSDAEFQVTTEVAIRVRAQHFRYASGLQESHSLVIRSVTIDGEELAGEDEVGVFTPDGVCAGAVFVGDGAPYGLSAWGDDPRTIEVDGFLDGEEFDFRLWDVSAEMEYMAHFHWEEGPQTWESSGLTIFSEVFAFSNAQQLIELSANAHDFGPVLVGDEADWILRIFNNGFSDLTVTGIRSDNEVFSSDFTDDIVIAPLGRADVMVTFTPGGEGEFTGSLTISSDDPEHSEVMVSLLGVGTLDEYATIELSPEALNFGEYPVGGSLAKRLDIANNGTVDLHIDQIVVDGDGFRTDWDGNTLVVPPRESVEMAVFFEPVEETDYRSTLTLHSDARDNAEAAVSLAGRGVAFNRHFVFQRVEQNHSLFVTAATLDGAALMAGDEIGVFTPGGLCAGASVLVEDANGNLFPVGMAAWGDDRRTPEVEGFTRGEEFAFRIWNLAEGVEYGAEPTYEKVNPDDPDPTWSANGLSYLSLASQRSLEGDIYVVPSELNFGSAYVGGTVELGLSVRNVGLGDLRVSNIASSDPDNFHVDFGVGFILHSMAERTITTHFTPQDAMSYTESLTIFSNDPDESEFGVPLFGEGLASPPALRASEYEHQYPATLVGQSSIFDLTLMNDGWQDLVISEVRSDNGVFTTDFPAEGVILGREEHVVVAVAFMPDDAVDYRGMLTVVSNDGGVPGTETGIALAGSGRSGPIIVVEPPELDFGGVDWRDQFTENDELPLRITNAGNRDLTVSNIVILGAGFTTDFAGQFVLAPDEYRDVTVVFDPVEVAAYGGIIRIMSDDPTHPVVYLRLFGEGIYINHPPYWAPEPMDVMVTLDVGESEVIEFTVNGADLDGDALTLGYRSGDLPPEATFHDNGDGTGTFHWEVGYGDRGRYTAFFTVSDGESEVTAEVGIGVRAKHFRYLGGVQENHSLVIRSAKIDGVELGLDGEIGVFTPDGVCAGAGFVGEETPYGFSAWGDDPGTMEVEGFLDGEEFNFRLWDAVAGMEYLAHFRWEEGPETWESSGLTIFSEVFAFSNAQQLIELSANAHDFGPVLVDDTANWRLRVFNNGFSDLTVTGISSDNGVFSSDFADTIVITPLGGADVMVTFTPSGDGEFTGSLTISSDDPDHGEVMVSLMGMGTYDEYATMELSPSALNFGEYPVNTSLAKHLDIANNGTVDLQIDQIVVDGDGFRTDWDGNTLVVPARESRELRVIFEPVDEIDYHGTLTIHSDARDNAEAMVSLAGRGVAFNRHFVFQQVEQNHSLFVTAATLDGAALVSGDEIGVFTPGGLCAGASVLQEDENGNVFPVGLAAWGDDRRTEEVEGFVRDEVFAFRIWNLAEEVEYSADPTYEEGSPNAWRANGLSYLSLESQRSYEQNIDVYPQQLDFGSVDIGGTVELEFTIRNVGLHALSVADIVTSDRDNFPFELNVGFSLRYLAERTFTAVFTPQDSLDYTEYLTIYSNDPDEGELMVPLFGRGIYVNHAPEVVNPIPDQYLQEDFEAYTVANLNDVFSDVDGGDQLAFSVESGDAALQAAVTEEGDLILSADENWYGQTEVTVTADDQYIDAGDGNDGVPGRRLRSVREAQSQVRTQLRAGIGWRAGPGRDATVEDLFMVNVAPVNDSPFWVQLHDSITLNEDEAIEFGVRADDVDPDALILSVELPEGALFTDNGDRTGTFSWRPSFEQAGEYVVTFIVSDGVAESRGEVAIKVLPVNRPPVWVDVPEQVAGMEGDVIDFIVTGSDPDRDQVSISLGSPDLPMNEILFADRRNGTAQFIWETGLADAGEYHAIFQMSDWQFNVMAEVVIVVREFNRPPVWTSIPQEVHVDAGQEAAFTMTGEDPDGDPLTISYHSDDIVGATFVDNGDGSGSFSWVPEVDGVYQAFFTLSDRHSEVTERVFVTVGNVNRPPSWVSVPQSFTVNETDIIDFAVQASDPNDDAMAISFNEADFPEATGFTDNGDGTGTFHWETSYDDAGRYTLMLTVTDGVWAVTKNIPITVRNLNRPPDWTLMPEPIAVNETELVTFDVAAVDLDGDFVIIRASQLPAGASFYAPGDGTGSFRWQTDYDDAGEYTILVKASDIRSEVTSEVSVTVNNVNRAPYWVDAPQEVSGQEGAQIRFRVRAADPDLQELTLTMSGNLPEGAGFEYYNDGTGFFAWTPGYEDEGDYLATLTVSDGELSAETSVAILVQHSNRAPHWVLVPDGQVTLNENEKFEFRYVGEDLDGDHLSISFDPDGLPQSAQFTDHGDGSGTLSWTPGYDDAGDYTATLTLSDGLVEATTQTGITVNDVNRAPVWTQAPDAADVGEGVTLTVNLAGNDPDGSAVTINYESANLPESAQFTDNGDGTASLVWTPAYDEAGQYSATFTLSDGIAETPHNLTITVHQTNRAPYWTFGPENGRVTGNENEPISFTGGGTDPDGDRLTISYHSDDLPPNVQFLDYGDGTGSFTWTPTYAEAGEYHATFTLSDGIENVPAEVTITVINVNRAPAFTEKPDTVTAYETFSVDFNMIASDPDGDVVTLSYASENIPEAARFTDNGDGTGAFTWQTTYTDEGEYSATFVVSDGDSSAEATVAITVLHFNQPPVWEQIPTRERGQENVEITFNVVGSDPDNDPLTITADLEQLPPEATFVDYGDGSGTFSWTPSFADAHEYFAFFTLSDGEFDVERRVRILVNQVDRAPEWVDVPAQVDGLENEPVEFSVMATDPDDDPLTITYSSDDLPDEVRFNYLGGGVGVVRWTPSFDNAGNYTAHFVASDDSLTAAVDVPIVIANVNQPPVFGELVDLVEGREGEPVYVMFNASDPDGDALTMSWQSPNLPDSAVFVDNGDGTAVMSLYPNYDEAGQYFIRGRASDSQVEVISSGIRIVIYQTNRAPEVAQGINDALIDEDAPRTQMAVLSQVFSDPDGDRLTYQAASADAGLMVDVSAQGLLFIQPTANWNGVTLVYVDAMDAEFTASDTFQVTVTPVSDPPVLPPPGEGGPSGDYDVPEDGGFWIIADLDTVFRSPDTTQLYFWVEGGEHLHPVIDAENVLSIDPDSNWSGDETFIVWADTEPHGVLLQSEGEGGAVNVSELIQPSRPRRDDAVSWVLTIHIPNVNDPPVGLPIADQTLNEDTGPWVVADLDEVMSDPDNDPMTLSVSVDEPLTANIDPGTDNLILNAPLNYFGSGLNVTVTATDVNQTSGSVSFVVNVLAVNDPPTIAHPVVDMEFSEDSGPWTIADLDTVFADVDDAVLNYSVSGDESVSWSLDENNVLTFGAPVNFSSGVMEFGIAADDGHDELFVFGGGRVNLRQYMGRDIGPVRVLRTVNAAASPGRDDLTWNMFDLTISAVNDTPFITDAPTVVESVELGSVEFDVTADDPDFAFEGDRLTWMMTDDGGTAVRGARFFDNRDNTASFTWLTGYGDAGVYAPVFQVADLGGLTVQTTVVITVANVNRGPELTQAIAGQAINEDAGETALLNLGNFFNDPDNDPLSYTVGVSDTMVTVRVEAGVLYATPAANWYGSAVVSLTASDGTSQVATEFILTVNSVNDLPTAATLLGPVDGKTTYDFPRVKFWWSLCVDPVEDSSVTYSVGIRFTGGNTMWFSGLQDTLLWIARSELALDRNHPTTMTWEVWASDGIDSVRSPDVFTLMAAPMTDHELGLLLVPTEVKLGPLYPNPFNNAITIEFGLPESYRTEVDVFNASGQRVQQLVNGILPAGSHRVTWNGFDNKGFLASAGIYIVRVTTPVAVKKQTIVLIR